ncbi:MAG: YraN family protein [Bacteroidetes bacterium]|nr:YraN family protein [Bacteroidota bacterium]
MATHNDLGKNGENIAANYLTRKGYQIIKRNWRYNRDEIDIIAKDGDWLVIVEVKTRTSDWFGEPEMAVTRTKQQSLVRAAQGYIMETDFKGETRFDVIGILFDKQQVKLNHVEDAFLPG